MTILLKIMGQDCTTNFRLKLCVFAGGSGEGDGGSGDVESLLALGGGSGDEGSGLTGADALAEVLSAQGTFIEDPFFLLTHQGRAQNNIAFQGLSMVYKKIDIYI